MVDKEVVLIAIGGNALVKRRKGNCQREICYSLLPQFSAAFAEFGVFLNPDFPL